MQSKTHWEKIYTTKSSTDVSWYRPHAALSMDLIQRIGVGPDAAIIDVGGGASTLIDDLVAHGYRNLSQYDPDSLHGELGPAFEPAEHNEEMHVTPAGRVQHFMLLPLR